MAKHAHQKVTDRNPVRPKPTNGSSDGYVDAEQLVQPAGYWQPEAGPLHGVLVGGFKARAKSGKSKGKLRVTYIFKLIDQTPARVKVESPSGKVGYDDSTLDPGELCAVFDSVGLRALRDLQGCAVKLERKPERKALPSGNEMWLFSVRYRGERKPLTIREAFETPSDDERDDEVDESYSPADGDEVPF